jgi:hypothetical protein
MVVIDNGNSQIKNSWMYLSSSGWQSINPDWLMHVIVEYPPNVIEYTSIGTVKALFR